MTGKVYAIVNHVSGRAYIGATRRPIRERWSVHRSHLRAGDHENRPLQADWDQYGAEAFDWVPLEDVEDGTSHQHREDHWATVYRERGIDLYNIRPILARVQEITTPNPDAQELAALRWSKRTIEKVCPFCEKTFRGDGRQIYCKPEHQNAAAAQRFRSRHRAVAASDEPWEHP